MVRIGSEHRNTTNAPHAFLIDSTGQVVFPLPHMEIYPYVSLAFALGYGLVAVRTYMENTPQARHNTLFGIFDMQGNELIAPTFQRVFPFNEGISIVRRGYLSSRHGGSIRESAIDTDGNEVIPPIYSYMLDFNEGLAGVSVGDWDWTGRERNLSPDYGVLWGFVDMEGNEVIPPRFRHVSHFTHGVAVVIPRVYGDTECICELVCCCECWRSPPGRALINTRGEYVISPGTYDGMWVCDQGIVIVVAGDWGLNNRRFGLSDLEGNELVPPTYRRIRNFARMLDGPRQDRYLNDNPAIPTFRDGRAAVQCYYTNLWGYIDMAGYEIIPPQFMYSGAFINGIALVNEGGEERNWMDIDQIYVDCYNLSPIVYGTWHVIDLYGNILKSFEYTYVSRLNENLLVFTDELILTNRGSWRLGNLGIFVIDADNIDQRYGIDCTSGK